MSAKCVRLFIILLTGLCVTGNKICQVIYNSSNWSVCEWEGSGFSFLPISGRANVPRVIIVGEEKRNQ